MLCRIFSLLDSGAGADPSVVRMLYFLHFGDIIRLPDQAFRRSLARKDHLQLFRLSVQAVQQFFLAQQPRAYRVYDFIEEEKIIAFFPGCPEKLM